MIRCVVRRGVGKAKKICDGGVRRLKTRYEERMMYIRQCV